MKLKYNAPTTLTFALSATLVLLVNEYLMPDLIKTMFTAEGSLTFRFDSIPSYVRIFTHILGHSSWEHLLSNLTLILLLGPILEEKYRSKPVAWMIVMTTLANGLANALFFETALTGSSGVAFMMILLVSFANIRTGEFPLSAILVVGLYLFKEILVIFRYDDVSQISHIIGAACGAFFGFTRTVRGSGGARNKTSSLPSTDGGEPIPR